MSTSQQQYVLKAGTTPQQAATAPFLTRDGWWRLGVGFALIGVWLAVLVGAPAALPMQAASWLTFLALLIAPGYLLGDIITRGMQLDWLERVAIAFPLGLAILSVPGLAALLIHETIDGLAVGWVATSTVVVVAWIVFTAWNAIRRKVWLVAEPWRAPEMALLVLLVLAFLVSIPALDLYKIDGDAYAVGSFAADAMAGLPLNSVEPLFNTQLGPGVRMAFNQSLPMTYLWSYWSEIGPLELTAAASRAMVALWAVLAAYALGRAAGGRRLGLLVALVQMLVYLANPFLRGDSVSLFFFERTTADKFMVPITLLPVAFAFTIYFFRDGDYRAWTVAALTAFAVSAIHPLIAAMMAMALTAFGLFHWALNWRSRAAAWRTVLVGVLVVVTMVLPGVQLVMSRGEAPLAPSFPTSIDGWPVGEKLVPALPFVYAPTLDAYGPLPDLSQLDAQEADSIANPFLIWRFAVNMVRRRLILFDIHHYISDPNIVLELPYLLALLALPFLLRGVRKNLGVQFAAATTASILFAMFNPFVTPLIGSFVMPWILWRFVWMLPYALILGMALDRFVPAAVGALQRVFARGKGNPATTQMVAGYALPAVVLLLGLALSPAIVQNLRTLQERAGFPYFYPAPERLLNELDRLTRASGPAVVLADQDLSVSIPAYAADANIIAHRIPTTSEIFPADQQQEALQRLIDQDAFYRSRYLTDKTVEILNRYQTGYVIVPSGSNLDVQLRLATNWFDWIMDDQSYTLYAVRELPESTPAIAGNTALAERQWQEAEAHYHTALAQTPDDQLALVGLAEIAHARGEFVGAVELYEAALAVRDQPVLHYRLGQLYSQLGQVKQAIAEFDIAQEMAPNSARFHVALGDACLSAGNDTCASEQYAEAVEHRNLPDPASKLVAQADLWRQRGRTDQALTLYEAAVAEQPSEANQLMLVSAYQEEQRFAEAEALLEVVRMQRPLSVEAMMMAAGVKVAQRQYDAAIDLYKRAIWVQELTGQEPVQAQVALAQSFLDTGRLDEAGATLDELTKLQPNNATVHSLRGDLYNRLGLSQEATQAYEQAFRLDPTQVQLYLALSNQFQQQGGRQAEILDLLQTAMRANPDEATLALALGDQLQQRGDTAAAVDAYQAALDMFEVYSLPNSLTARAADTSRAFAYTRLAAVSEDLGQMEPAMNYYSAAAAAAPDVPWTQVMYGDALRRRGDDAGAEAAYRTAIDNDPSFANAYVQLADLVEARGNQVEADLLRNQALEVALHDNDNPALAKAHPGLGSAVPETEAQAGKSFNSDATEVTNTSVGQAPGLNAMIASLTLNDAPLLRSENSGALSILARLAQASGQLDGITKLYQDAIDAGEQQGWYPATMARYYKGLGDLYLAQEQPLLATEAYQNAIARDDWWPQARLGLARALDDQGRKEEALAQLQSAVEIAPGYVEGQLALADAYSERGDGEQAFGVIKEAASKHPGNSRATLALAQAWQARGEQASAEKVYRQTIAQNPGDGDAYVGLATLLLEQARDREAEPLLASALEKNHANVNALMQMGVLAQRQGNGSAALEWFRQAGEAQPGNEAVQLVLVDLMQRFGYTGQALAAVEDALAATPQDAELLLRQARLQRAGGDFGKAMQTLLNAARYDLHDSRLAAELGELYLAQGRPQAALAAYRQTVALDPEESGYYLRLAELWDSQAELAQSEALLRSGFDRASHPEALYAAQVESYLQQGRVTEAKALIEEGIARLGEQTPLLLAMGAALDLQSRQAGNPADVVEEWYTGALEHHPNEAALHRALGDYYLRVERVDEALASLEKAVELAPSNATYRLALGAGYEAAGRMDDALLSYQRAVQLEPSAAEGYMALANAYAEMQNWDEAEQIFQQGMDRLPANGLLLVDYGERLAEQGDFDRALEMLARAGEVAPTAETLTARAGVYTRLRKESEALADLEAALVKEPGSVDAMLALGDLYRDLGKSKEAQQMYADAAELSPSVAAGRLGIGRLNR